MLQFGYGDGKKNEHHHSNVNENTICYIGTHDNNTTKGWFKEMKFKDQTRNFQTPLKKDNF